MEINSIEEALKVFQESAIEHTKATEVGDYKSANKNHSRLVAAAKYLKEKDRITELKKFFTDSNAGVKIWAGTFLLNILEKEAKDILETISKQNILHHSFTAKMTLEEWDNGNLKLPF